MRILSLIHETEVPSGSFSATARELGHSVDDCSFSLVAPARARADTYDAVMIFGGVDNVAERAANPWMERELLELVRLIAGGTPVLGVCLGGQMIAAAAGGSVFPMGHERAGWQEVELVPEAPEDPLVGALPTSLPGVAVARVSVLSSGERHRARDSDDCLQAFRLGDYVWALQFHPEVTAEIADRLDRAVRRGGWSRPPEVTCGGGAEYRIVDPARRRCLSAIPRECRLAWCGRRVWLAPGVPRERREVAPAMQKVVGSSPISRFPFPSRFWGVCPRQGSPRI